MSFKSGEREVDLMEKLLPHFAECRAQLQTSVAKETEIVS